MNHQDQCDGTSEGKFPDFKPTVILIIMSFCFGCLLKKKKISLCWRNSSLSAILVPVLLLSLFCERRRKKEGRGELKQREEEEERERDVYSRSVSADVSCFQRQLRSVSVYLLSYWDGERLDRRGIGWREA